MENERQAKIIIPANIPPFEEPCKPHHFNHVWDKINGIGIINAGKETYTSWKTSSSILSSAAYVLESGLARVFGPLESATESIADKFPNQGTVYFYIFFLAF